MTGKPVELIPRPESSVQVLTLPLSTTGADGKAQRYQIRNERGDTICTIDAASRTVGVVYPHVLQLPAFTGAQRDAITGPTGGMLIYNSEDRTIELYRTAAGWIPLAF